jgi:orotate phosphoribosyltransferase
MDDARLSIPEARTRLIDIIKARSFQVGGEMKLASGRTSTFYFNMKPTMLDPEGGYLIGRLVLELISGDGAEMIGGLEMGAVPLATSVATVSFAEGKSLPAFFVRKQAKEHGTQVLIEGLPAGQSIAGCRVVVVEDVTTTGGSALKAVAAVRESGAEVASVVTLVDREEGARAAFADAGVVFMPAWSERRLLLGSFTQGGSRRTDIRVDVALELFEVLLEHVDEGVRLLVVCLRILPGLARVEDLVVDAFERGWHLETEDRISAHRLGAEFTRQGGSDQRAGC